MRRVFLLGLLALALPMAALASTVDYQASGSSAAGTATFSGNVAVNGSLSLTMALTGISTNGATAVPASGTVAYSITLGSSCGTGCFNITSGTVTVTNASNTTLFSSSFTGGQVNSQNGVVDIVNVAGFVVNGGASATVLHSGNTVLSASGDVIPVVAPEPGTLGLRRKLKGEN